MGVDAWPADFPVAQVRVARPTDQLEEVVRFYRDGLGLRVLRSYKDYDGYDGVMIGLPGVSYHLEVTRRDGGGPCPAPSRHNLLVLYVEDRAALLGRVERLRALGCDTVEPENPYWAGRGYTFEDPYGWRVVLMNTAGISG